MNRSDGNQAACPLEGLKHAYGIALVQLVDDGNQTTFPLEGLKLHEQHQLTIRPHRAPRLHSRLRT